MTREELKKDFIGLDKLFNEAAIEYGQENTTIDSGEWYYITARQHDLISRQDAYIQELESLNPVVMTCKDDDGSLYDVRRSAFETILHEQKDIVFGHYEQVLTQEQKEEIHANLKLLKQGK